MKRKYDPVDDRKPYLWIGRGADPQRIAHERLRDRGMNIIVNRVCANCKAKGNKQQLEGHWVDRDNIRHRFLCSRCYRAYIAQLP